jgi:hypothetical protein
VLPATPHSRLGILHNLHRDDDVGTMRTLGNVPDVVTDARKFDQTAGFVNLNI